jgi:hypothetical protein
VITELCVECGKPLIRPLVGGVCWECINEDTLAKARGVGIGTLEPDLGDALAENDEDEESEG